MSVTLTFGSLFAGIGGMDLGLERAGMTCKWQIENDDFCQQILQKHWPDVPKFGDVKDVGRNELETVDLIAGGFPCQDVSLAGKQDGIEGQRSGLWSEYARIISEIKPRWVLVENVPGLRSVDVQPGIGGGLGIVLRDLAACGYDAEWESIPAAAIGAPQIRDRLFLVAYPQGVRCNIFKTGGQGSNNGRTQNQGWGWVKAKRCTDRVSFDLASRHCLDRLWNPIPNILRVLDGPPSELDLARLEKSGNAVVPQVAEWIGQRIMEVADTT